jgi:hypothetical protein
MHGSDLDSNPHMYFSHRLHLPLGGTIDAIVDDFNYLRTDRKIGSTTAGAAIVILRQFGYINNPTVNRSAELTTHLEKMIEKKDSHELSPFLFIELSNEKTYSFRGNVLGKFHSMLKEDLPPCDTYPLYPFPCSKYILKFTAGKDTFQYLPPFDPEMNTDVKDYIQVYTVNKKHYVHYSTGLTMNGPTLGGRRRKTVRRSR